MTDYEPHLCKICGADMQAIECEHCDDGICTEEDPVNGDDYFPCPDCNAQGHYLECSALPHSDEQMAAWRRASVKP